MPPLKNLRHEKFAQELIASNSNKEAYEKAYPESVDNQSAIVSASRLLTLDNVRQRVFELMTENADTMPKNVVARLGQLVNSENEGVAMNAVNTALKAFRVFDTENVTNNIESINVVFAEAPKKIDSHTA